MSPDDISSVLGIVDDVDLGAVRNQGSLQQHVQHFHHCHVFAGGVGGAGGALEGRVLLVEHDGPKHSDPHDQVRADAYHSPPSCLAKGVTRMDSTAIRESRPRPARKARVFGPLAFALGAAVPRSLRHN
eukprot:4830235-Alexandrium_andersonii.AAC.1